MSKGLLAQIEAGVLGDEPLPRLLQKCVVLGGRAGSEKMRGWARQELNGYPNIKDIPPYRKLVAQVKVTLTNPMGYQPVTSSFSTAQLPESMRSFLDDLDAPLEQVPMSGGIGELDALASSGKDEHWLVPWWADVLLPVLNEHYVDPHTTRVRDVYWALSNAQLKGLLVQVRTNLAELVGELLSLTPENGEPSKEAADAVTVFLVTGDRNVFTNLRQETSGGTAIGSQNASGDGSSVIGNQAASGEGNTITGRDVSPTAPAAKEGFFKRWRKRGIIVGIATVVAAIVGLLQLLDQTPW
ncbi:hypothetical protein [Prauserella muralis]|uniref:AbiTii domain-containing protein n=1 Tax=Prauserella muralis TaxID=588067 RepID=A0A2V4ABZ0_9PSEU|nr:hypothetical protein [Prauserella muralis]PXY16626.1 hypothetical protein BAY60_36155 [Prauserella muralis]TWE11124.1 hypothetical protein FHX69_7343 [Prauserella muralis]